MARAAGWAYIRSGKNARTERERVLSTATLIWLFPIVFMLHDFEELIRFRRWMDRYGPAVGLRLPTFIRVNFDRVQSHTTAEYAVPIALEFILFSAASLLAVEARWIALFNLCAIGVFAHTFFHLGSALWLRQLTPGVTTAMLFVLPYSVLLFTRLIAEGLLDPRWVLFGTPLILPVFGIYMRLLFILSGHLTCRTR